MRTLLGGVSIDIPPHWVEAPKARVACDTSDYTFLPQTTDASGALQMSFALYREGPISEPTPEELMEMLGEFAAANQLADATEPHCEGEALRLAAATFHDEEYTVRVWFVSDGASFAQVTYTAHVGVPISDELQQCERMVRTIHFPSASAVTA